MAGEGRASEGQDGPIRHGGDLGEAVRLFPRAPTPWIDLSTGINPIPYPWPALEASAFTRLPSAADLAALEEAAARAYGARPGQVVAAPGTQALIDLIPRLRPPGRVAVVGPTYAEHAASWARAGHAVATVPDLTAEADAVVVVNPNNPDGRFVTRRDLAIAAAGLAARGGWLVVDEAFADLETFSGSADPRPADSAPVESLCAAPPPGCLVLRSFGKTYGLAGLRLGFAVAAEPLIGLLRGALGPWAVSGPAIAVGRLALADEAWQREAAAARGRDAARLDALIAGAGGRIVGGTRLFRTADFPDGPGLFGRLGRAGIFVRRFEAAPARLRFGLPPDAAAWARLASVLGAG